MKTIGNLLGTVVAIAIVGGIAVGAYFAGIYLWVAYLDLDPVVRLVLFTAVAALLLAATIVGGALRSASRRVVGGELAAERLQLYLEMVELCRQAVDRPVATDGESLSALKRLDSRVLLLASDDVLDAYFALQNALSDDTTKAERLQSLAERLVQSCRRDIGQKSRYDRQRSIRSSGRGSVPNKSGERLDS